jgi:Putative beta barrel porin-7 (BBP7)
MKGLLRIGLSLTLGLAPAASFAQELNWRAGSGAGNAAPPNDPQIMLSRPVPFQDAVPAAPSIRPIVRGQNPEDKPLPPGPLSLSHGSTPSFTLAQQGTPPVMPKADGVVPPQPKLTMPLANGQPPVWGPTPGDRLLGLTGEGGSSCGNPCCDPCAGSCGAGWLSHFHWFRHDDCGNPCPNLCCDPCKSGPRIWVFADYLLWAEKGQHLPPLVTTSPAGVPLVDPVTGAPIAGVLGQPTTTVAFDRFDNPARSGMRIGGGAWFTQDCVWGMDASYWFLAPFSRADAFSGNAATQVFRPITSAALAPGGAGFIGPTAQFVSIPGLLNGTATVGETQDIWGLEANLRRRLCCGPNGWVDFLVGYRHFSMNESLNISENLMPLGPGGIPATTILIADRFATSNNFNAPQVGVAGQWQFAPRWSIWGSFRVATGVNDETVRIAGSSVLGGTVFNGGILALPTNIGTHARDRFAVMPELNLKLAYDITPRLSLYAGYDFLYISNVVRPGRQVDLNVNLNQVPPNAPTPLVGSASPAPIVRGESFWMQGVNFGVMYRY